jgi:glucose/arabinose dehydrogenase
MRIGDWHPVRVPRRPLALTVLLAALGALAVAPGAAQDERARSAAVRLVQVGSFGSPTYVSAPRGDERLFVTEQAGVIRIMRDGRTLGRPFLDIRDDVSCCGERGLFSMAFAPDFERSRRFYVYFTDNQGDIVVRGYRASASDADVAIGGRRVIEIAHRRFSNHNGGQLQFGPDGLLYIGTGDGGGGGDPLRNAQDRGSLLGKLLRIDPRRRGGRRYRTPRTNPFRGRRPGRPEVYAYGLRNPYRFSFDRDTGDLTIADVGQNAVEEVNFRRRGGGRGANFGWNRFEGRRRFSPGRAPGHVPPVLQRFSSQGACTVIGGYVVRDPELADLFGRYVYGDLCDSALRSARLRPGRARGDRQVGVSVSRLVSFGEDGAGRVYAVSLRGPVYRLAPG